VGDITTYPGYITATTTPVYTLTSMTFTTDDYTTASPWIPTAIATPALPQASGTWSNCSIYSNYFDIPEFRDQMYQKDTQFVPSLSNNCNYTAQTFGINFSDFSRWNPSLANGTCNCVLTTRFSYCVYIDGVAENTDYASSDCLEIGNPPNGTVAGCTCFTELEGYDAPCKFNQLVERLY